MLTVVVPLVAVILVGGAVLVGTRGSGTAGTGPADAVPPPAVDPADVAAVPARSVADLDPVRLADGLLPPTNRWFSGLVFGETAQPVFALPLSVSLTDGGFSLGVPVPVTSEAAVLGPHLPALTVDVGARSADVVAYDDASVTVALRDGAGGELARFVLAEGSPLVPLTATVDLEVRTDLFGDVTAGEVTTVERDGRTWGVLPPADAAAGAGLRVAAGETITWFALPDGAPAAAAEALASAAAHPVTGTAASHGLDDDIARTTIEYRTVDDEPTAWVTMPHHRAGEQPERSCGLGTYPSVYGDLELCTGTELSSWAPRLEPAGALDLAGLDPAEREVVIAQLAEDVASTPDDPADTYFGGKWLARAATLVVLGEQLGAADVVQPLRERASSLLRQWAEPQGCAVREARCFVHDPGAGGIVGFSTSFGSEQFNDHHFHYGYFLAAAGMLGADDQDLVADVAPVMNLLAEDIAAGTGSPSFPRLRVMDVYAGHSWASGTSPFADGNNQESLSEAVNAWNGLGLWAGVSGREDLGVQAEWLLSTEAASTLYWTHLDLDDPVYEGFAHEVIALNWGGKRDWATWFSAEPSAMLGILLLPVTPVSEYLRTDPDRIRASIAEAAPDGYDVLFGDSLLMYRALAGPEDADAAWVDALALPDERVDDGMSRAFMLAWIAVHR
ncbi:glycosyl hydrolase [Actinotalea sp.]|uniref:glycosyl hydrolase n=1 Tax=Actinotalea sp. TaxID=1872145 RepID=UPI0035619A9C